ncbi:MAG: type II toxin-antitoxin system prevent-host-death family antitoxin [Anaerolineales bacterium]|jgi:prevent-host-death family protein|nr:type II toxin-antitoxin system prevent-host-death family antitoxin [Anaerolineales bacterium]
MTHASIRDLKANLSEYLRQVELGKTITITKRGKPIGRIVPEAASLEERMHALAAAGLVSWSGRKLSVRKPAAINRGPRRVSDLVSEDRDVHFLP